MTGEPAIEAIGLEKSYGDGAGAGRRRPAGRARHACSRCSAPTARARRRRSGSWPRCCARTPAGRASRASTSSPTGARSARAISLTGQYAAVDELQTGEENLRMMGRLAGLAGAARAGPRARSCSRGSTSTDAARPPGRDLLGRHAAAPRPRGEPRRPPVGDLPRRADDRPGPAQPARDVGRRHAASSASGVTVFLTTQYLEEADRLADRIAVIDGGRVVAEGTPAELKRRVAEPAARPRARRRGGLRRPSRARSAGRVIARDAGRPRARRRDRRQRGARARAARRDRPRRRRGRALRRPQRDARRRLPRPHRPHHRPDANRRPPMSDPPPSPWPRALPRLSCAQHRRADDLADAAGHADADVRLPVRRRDRDRHGRTSPTSSPA